MLSAVEYCGHLIQLFLSASYSALVTRTRSLRATFRVVAAQIYFTGWQAIPLIFVVASVSGSLVIFYTANQVTPLGNADLGSTLLYLIVSRELGPLITGFIVIARSGTAVASEVGNMRANGEIEALQTMAIDPLSFVVFPRLLGGVVSLVCLVIYFNVFAVFAACIATVLVKGSGALSFLHVYLQQIELRDLCLVALKGLLMGLAIFSVSTYQGLQVRKSHHEVPQVTIKAVVINIIVVTVLNFLLTAALLFRGFHGGGL